jgi:hypothetical protein
MISGGSEINATEKELSLLAGDLQSGKVTENAAGLIRRIIDSGLSARLIGEAIVIGIQNGWNQTQAISRIMESLEAVARLDRTLGCILMFYLWGRASDEKMHDVCDAIDLWVFHSDPVEVQRCLSNLVVSEADPETPKHFKQLIKEQ